LLEIEIFRQPASDYNCAVTKKANPKRNLRPVTARAQMREFGSDAEWFWVEFLVYYDQSLIRAFGYVSREDGKDIANGVYQALDDLGERALEMDQTRRGMANQMAQEVEQVTPGPGFE